jgi:hypothetical protein
MPGDRVITFSPSPLDPEESVRRQHVEAARLARLAPGEWQLWIKDSAAQLGISRATLEASVKAIIAEQEKAKRERKAEEEHDRRRAEKAAAAKKKAKQRAFKTLEALPEAEQEKRLEEIAKRLDEDPATVREEFETSSPPPVDSKPELWPEAVETAKLLQELISQIKRFVVVHEDGAVAIALWTMMAWIHDAVATHSPILVITSAEPDSGKTTLLGLLAQLTPHPLSSAELTGPSLYRIVDRDHPTLIIDEADDTTARPTYIISSTHRGSAARRLPAHCQDSWASIPSIHSARRSSVARACRCRVRRLAAPSSSSCGLPCPRKRSRTSRSPTFLSLWSSVASYCVGPLTMPWHSPIQSRRCHPVSAIV